MEEKKKILFVLHVPPPVHGSSIVGLSIKNSEIINSAFDCRYINLLVSRKIGETGKFNMFKIFRSFSVWLELLKSIINQTPDLCYLALSTTGWAFYKDVLLIGLLRLFGIKRIYHLHNKGVSEKESVFPNRLLYHFVFKDAAVILLSNHLYKDIMKFVPLSNVYICPNGIPDVSLFDAKISDKTAEVPVITFLSNLIESKGVYDLLDACKIIQNKGLDFQCKYIGAESDISAEKFNKRVTELGLEQNVKYVGKKYGEEKNVSLMESDIFAFPTFYHNECFPLVLLEAMSANLPIVSTYEGGIPDIVDEGITGYLVAQRDVRELAEKLETLIVNEKLRKKMGEAARNKFVNDFKLEMFEARLKNILDEFLLQI